MPRSIAGRSKRERRLDDYTLLHVAAVPALFSQAALFAAPGPATYPAGLHLPADIGADVPEPDMPAQIKRESERKKIRPGRPMKTAFVLMLQYDGKVIIPVEQVCADYFHPMTLVQFMRLVISGEIDLPIVRMYDSQKAGRGVPVEDLARYVDKRIADARKDADAVRAARQG